MCKMYGIIEGLCSERGIKPGKLCADLGISRGIMGDLKAGRTKKLSAKNIEKVSRYFGVPSDYLLGATEAKKAPTEDGEHKISEEDIKLALFGGDGEVTDAMWDEAQFAIQLIKERYKL